MAAFASLVTTKRAMPVEVYNSPSISRIWKLINQVAIIGKNVCNACYNEFTSKLAYEKHIDAKSRSCPIECPPVCGTQLENFFSNKFFQMTPGTFLCQFGCQIETSDPKEIANHLGTRHSEEQLQAWLLHK